MAAAIRLRYICKLTIVAVTKLHASRSLQYPTALQHNSVVQASKDNLEYTT
jgi:hypothetical protein